MRFRTAMLTAKVYTVDIDDDESFGTDINGEEMGIDGMAFTLAQDYLPGIEVKDREIGCFADETMKRSPIRILTKETE